jgi:lactate dehydrogenase-like 2-hydroxyacid dehydrogenase
MVSHGFSVQIYSLWDIEHIDIKAAKARGIRLGHTPNVLNDAVADITVMLVLMTMRRAQEGIDLVKSGNVGDYIFHVLADSEQWSKVPWAPFVMCGPSITHPNLTIGFLGFGRISQFVLRRLLAFTNKSQPPNIIYLSSRSRPNQAEIDEGFTKEFGVDVKRVEKDQIAEKSDIVIVLCDQNPGTVNLVNKEFLGRMKKTAILVNCARVGCVSDHGSVIALTIIQGPIVNSDDLAEALEKKQIFGAGLDVIAGEPHITGDHPLVKLSNCESCRTNSFSSILPSSCGQCQLDKKRLMDRHHTPGALVFSSEWLVYIRCASSCPPTGPQEAASSLGVNDTFADFVGVVLPHMGSADLDTRNAMAERCK